MAKLTLKLNKSNLANIEKKLNALEKELTAEGGIVFKYMLTVANGYREAVVSGMGKTEVGTLTLKSFLGTSQQVSWKPLAPVTTKKKAREGWKLEIWMATGQTADAVKVFSKSDMRSITVAAGIDPGSFEYEKAIQAEFGGISSPGGKEYEGRALFTLLNIVFKSNSEKIKKAILRAVKEAIQNVGWGR